MSSSNATPNYQVTAENAAGLLFKNKRDRKILNVDPKVTCVERLCLWLSVTESVDIKTFCAINIPAILNHQKTVTGINIWDVIHTENSQKVTVLYLRWQFPHVDNWVLLPPRPSTVTSGVGMASSDKLLRCFRESSIFQTVTLGLQMRKWSTLKNVFFLVIIYLFIHPQRSTRQRWFATPHQQLQQQNYINGACVSRGVLFTFQPSPVGLSNYIAWWQRQLGVRNLNILSNGALAGSRTRTTKNTPYHYAMTLLH